MALSRRTQFSTVASPVVLPRLFALDNAAATRSSAVGSVVYPSRRKIAASVFSTATALRKPAPSVQPLLGAIVYVGTFSLLREA